MEQNDDPGKLETYAIVEVMGHNKFAGYVQQVPFGGAAMIRIDVPEIPESEEEYLDYEYGEDGRTKSVKKTRKVPGSPQFTKFLGVSSIFAITPCSKEVALAAVKQFRSAPVTILQMPQPKQLVGFATDEDPDDEEDDPGF